MVVFTVGLGINLDAFDIQMRGRASTMRASSGGALWCVCVSPICATPVRYPPTWAVSTVGGTGCGVSQGLAQASLSGVWGLVFHEASRKPAVKKQGISQTCGGGVSVVITHVSHALPVLACMVMARLMC